MQNAVEALIADLLASKTSEAPAGSVLAQMLLTSREALRASRYAPRGRMLRAMVHLRPDDAYRTLVVLEEGASSVVPVSLAGHHDSHHDAAPRHEAPVFLPSASAWRWIADRRCPVAIDVLLGKMQPMLPMLGDAPAAARG